MSDIVKESWAKRFSQWYFSKRVLPYWCIILMDMAIVFVSCFFTFWVSRRTLAMVELRSPMIYTSLLYTVLSLVGARIFRTYSGVIRYSSFVDLLKVAKANLVSLALAIGLSLLFKYL